jgi:hypothetical protein
VAPVTTGTPGAIVSDATADATTTLFPPNDKYLLQVSYTVERDEASGDAGPPEGSQWLIVVAAIENESAQPLTVARGSLILISENGEEFEADAPDESTQPPLVGAELAPGESILGLVRFTIPNNTVANVLQWCPLGLSPCEVTVRAPIP